MSTKWPRRAEFVNMVLAWGVAYSFVKSDRVKYDGDAGKQFDGVVGDDETGALESYQRDELIDMALQTGVPVEGLVADGTFGEKWAEVLALCKETD